MMVDPDADGDNIDYYELQINPQNKVFKSQFDTLQQPSGGPNGPFGHEDWDPKLKSAVPIAEGRRRQADRATPSRRPSPGRAYAKAAEPPAEAGRRVARELLRHEEQRRRRVVAHPGAGQLPQGVALRTDHLDDGRSAPAGGGR